MSLQEHTLFGLVDKVALALERIKTFCPPEGYYVAYSGGKDSDTILDLVRRSGVKYDAHFMRAMEPPEVVYHVRTQKDVEMHMPEVSYWSLLAGSTYPSHGLMPPTRIVRWCCEHLKENGGNGRVVVTGIRWAESARRAKRQMMEACIKGGGKRYLHPIIDWSSQDVWEYLRSREIPYCKLYDEGYKRLGCIMCPMSGAKRMREDAERYPKIAAAYVRAMDKAVLKRRQLGLPTDWKDGRAMFEWWIDGNPAKIEDDGTIPMFE